MCLTFGRITKTIYPLDDSDEKHTTWVPMTILTSDSSDMVT